MNGDPQASGASAQNNGVGAPPPPLQEGRNWDRLFDVLMENSTRQDLVLQQVGGRLGLLEDIQRQTEAGETIYKKKISGLFKIFFMFIVLSSSIMFYLFIFSDNVKYISEVSLNFSLFRRSRTPA